MVVVLAVVVAVVAVVVVVVVGGEAPADIVSVGVVSVEVALVAVDLDVGMEVGVLDAMAAVTEVRSPTVTTRSPKAAKTTEEGSSGLTVTGSSSMAPIM